MEAKNYAKLQDRRCATRGGNHENDPVDLDPLSGTWVNTNVQSTGITKAVVNQDGGELSLRVFGASDGEPCDWGEVDVTSTFAESINSGRAISFIASYDFGFLKTELQANIAKGLLIITSLNRFKDDSARSDFFAREFFYRECMQPNACQNPT